MLPTLAFTKQFKLLGSSSWEGSIQSILSLEERKSQRGENTAFKIGILRPAGPGVKTVLPMHRGDWFAPGCSDQISPATQSL